jgi:hypothetical protein
MVSKRFVPIVVAAAALASAMGATRAAADTSACTHSFSGPQVCIRLDGRNGQNSITGIWTNPGSVKTHAVTMYMNDKPYSTKTATRHGDSLSYTWSSMNTGTDTKICVKFAGSSRMACETTRYIGDRASL